MYDGFLLGRGLRSALNLARFGSYTRYPYWPLRNYFHISTFSSLHKSCTLITVSYHVTLNYGSIRQSHCFALTAADASAVNFSAFGASSLGMYNSTNYAAVRIQSHPDRNRLALPADMLRI